MRIRTLLAINTVLVIVSLVVFNSTNPDEISAGGILFVFILLYLLSFFTTMLFFKVVLRLRMDDLSNSGQFMMVATIALVPVVALALNSLGQLFFRDLLILFGLSGMTIFYWLKRG